MQIYAFLGLRVKARVPKLQKYLKPRFFVFTLFMVIFSLKKIPIKRVFISNLTFINPYDALFGFKSQRNAGNFTVLACCTAANQYIRTQKISIYLLKISLQIETAYSQVPKPTGTRLKIAKTKQCLKNLDIRISRSKG